MKSAYPFAAAVVGAVMLSVPAAAQDEPGRYTMKDIEDGMLRLDTATGEVSYCRKKDDNWACDTAEDTRSVLVEQLAKLQEENATLRKRVAELEKKPEENQKLKLPSDQDLDKVMDFMDRLMRRFYAFTKSMRDQLEEKKPGEDT